uniref:ubiquitinyl hydrolase 1 n=1 Tax=Oncorhynchus tshawytscha TaxID=74940 RepID=A0A8C8MEE7_ONCTS
MDGCQPNMRQNNNEKSVEKCMDEYLKSIGFHRKKIAKDGSCLFRAVAEQVLHCQSLHTKVRATCVQYLKKNKENYAAFIEGDFEEYIMKLEDPQHWVGEVEICALALMYKSDFIIFQTPGKPPVQITDNGFNDKVRLCFLNGNHYDSVYPIAHVKNAALCQSVLYELLYERVCGTDHSVVAPCLKGGTGNRGNDLLEDDPDNEQCRSSDESDLEGEDALWSQDGPAGPAARGLTVKGRGSRGPPFSNRVRRSLNPFLYRNTEYDVWVKSKRAQQKLDFCIAAGMQYTVGDKCKVRLDNGGRYYGAYIQEVSPDNGPVTVFIEELGKKHTVSLWNLRPPTDDTLSWSTVARDGKRLNNGSAPNSDWEGRGRGRKSGKPSTPSATPSVSQAKGPSQSGGRGVQKQHSWPLQATVEEGGARSTNTRCL